MNKLIIILVFVVVCAVVSDAAKGLKYPGDCKSKILRSYAEKCGLKVSPGAEHFVVKDPKTNTQVTQIPHTVKENPTCRSIIRKLNARC
ncbi:hypothetical protein DPMN_039010 [Dreissena polymorpha]|uniref:Uncharacterized protein n=1 Tax=Dreissena polymorpha TaxID=45954 RepID=A0A9D4MGL3_DREPO|nr:hypothetical protein DPMN_039010 [Dreissena polymorpha]